MDRAVAEAIEPRTLFSGGLTGQYFNSTALTGYAFNRTDAQINYSSTESPGSGNGYTLSPSNFSVRWEGELVAPVSGVYTFDANVNGGERLYLNGISTSSALDDASFVDWTSHSTESSLDTTTMTLVAGNSYGIRFEYFSNTASPLATLNWTYTGQAQEAIPSSALLPLTTAAATYTQTAPSTAALTPTTGSLPAGWSQGDLSTLVSGDGSSYSNGTYTVKGTGHAGSSNVVNDSGQFAYTELTGDFSFQGEVSSITGSGSYGSFTGLMMRVGTTPSTLTPSGIEYEVGEQPGNGSAFRSWWAIRTVAGEIATGANALTNVTTPIWFKMVRGGNTIASYWSTDGVNWNFDNSQEFNNLPSTVSVGFLSSAYSGTQTCTGTFINTSITSPSSNNETSWVGNSFGGGLDHIPVAAAAAYLNPSNGELYVSDTDEDRGLTIMNPDGSILGYGQDSHFGGGTAVTASSNYIFLARNKTNGNIGGVQRYDLNGVPIFSGSTNPYTTLMSTESVTGLATFGNYLYLAVNNLVYQFTASTMAFTGFMFEADGAANMTADSSGNLWVVQKANGSAAAQIGHFSTTTGLAISGTIAFSGYSSTVVPSGVAVDSRGNVYVTDIGVLQQIHEYSTSGAHLTDIGYAGGIYGTGGGTIAGQAAPLKFNFPVGVGFDSAGEMYVVNGGPPVPGSLGDCTVIEKFASASPAAGLEWERESTTYIDIVSADPNNPTSAYSKFFTFNLNYNTDTPGQEFTITGTTVNPFTYPHDPRLVLNDPLTNPTGDNLSHGPILQMIDGTKFLIDSDGGAGENIYRFLNPFETVFCGQIYASQYRGTSNDEFAVWSDANGNGLKDAGETAVYPGFLFDHAFGRNVDAKGDIWVADYTGKFAEWVVGSTLNSAGAPTYTLANGKPWSYADFTGSNIATVQLDRAMIDPNGTLYLTGFTAAYPRSTTESFFGEAGRVIEEFPNFLTAGFGSGPSLMIQLPYSITDPMRETTVVGGYIFGTYANAGYGVEIYNAATGAHVATLLPSAYAGAGNGAGVDTTNSINVEQLTSGTNAGQFEIFVEDDAEAATTLYRWNPAQTVPTEGWVDQDVNVPAADPAGAGNLNTIAFGSPATWTLTGSGSDVGGTSDQFHYASTLLTGDGDIVAEVNSLTNTSAGAKAGVMIRDSTAAGSMFADVVVTPSDGVIFQWRSRTGGSASSVSVTGIAAPEWVKISRIGNVYTASYSTNGTTWTQIGTPQTLVFTTEASGNPSLVGLALTSQSASTLATATFTNVTINNPTVASGIFAAANPVPGTSIGLSVVGADPAGTAGLTYSWSTVGTPPAPVNFLPTGSNAAANTTASFTKAGTYTIAVAITDTAGFTTSSTLVLTVAQTPTTIKITPTGPTALALNGTQQFTSSVYDQFSALLSPQPTITWSLGGTAYGTISSTGLYTAPASITGNSESDIVTATADGLSVSSTVNLSAPAWLGPNALATWNATTHILSVTGATTIIADPKTDEPIITGSTSAAQVKIAPTVNDQDIHIGGVNLSGGAGIDVVSIGAARTHTDHNVLVVGTTAATTSPTFSIDSSSKLNLEDNDLIVHDGNLATMQSLAQEGRDAPDGPGNGSDGTWAGNGLMSSVAKSLDAAQNTEYIALAVVLNSDFTVTGESAFSSWTVGSASESLGLNDVIVKYTYYGDANLQGYVGTDAVKTVQGDYGGTATLVSQGYANDDWVFGDFDGSGEVNRGDVSDVQGFYGLGLPASGLAAL